MARVLLVHTTYEAIGGGEVFSIEVKKALKSLGHVVIHVTLNPGEKDKLNKLIGEVEFDEILPRPLLERVLYSFSRGGMVKLRRLLLAKAVLSKINYLIKKYKIDLVVDTSSGYPIPLDIVYLHQPTILALKRSHSISSKLYLRVILSLGKNVIGQPLIPVTNSSYTARLLKEIYPGLRDIRILHPPVDYDFYSRVKASCKNRSAVTLTRIERIKRLDVLLKVASLVPDWSIHVIGAAVTMQSIRFAEWLEGQARKRRLNNFFIHRNLQRNEILELFSEACAYIHPPYHEYFGIAIAEAMSAGLPPIVWREGGAWTDLVAPCCPQLGYKYPSEIPERLEEARARFQEYSLLARETASKFSHKEFRAKLASIIDEALGEKGQAPNS